MSVVVVSYRLNETDEAVRVGVVPVRAWRAVGPTSDTGREQQCPWRADHAVAEGDTPEPDIDEWVSVPVPQRALEVTVTPVERIDRAVEHVADKQVAAEPAPVIRRDRHAPRGDERPVSAIRREPPLESTVWPEHADCRFGVKICVGDVNPALQIHGVVCGDTFLSCMRVNETSPGSKFVESRVVDGDLAVRVADYEKPRATAIASGNEGKTLRKASGFLRAAVDVVVVGFGGVVAGLQPVIRPSGPSTAALGTV